MRGSKWKKKTIQFNHFEIIKKNYWENLTIFKLFAHKFVGIKSHFRILNFEGGGGKSARMILENSQDKNSKVKKKKTKRDY